MLDDDDVVVMCVWCIFGLYGVELFVFDVLVCYVSFYEVVVYVEWVGVWLLIEFEWEIVFVVDGIWQMFGYVWQWMWLFYELYLGFWLLVGVVVEYNGKFMVGQQVLCGSSIVMLFGYEWLMYCNFFLLVVCW